MDTATEKRKDMDEVAAGLMQGWEYRAKCYCEDEARARSDTGGSDEADSR